MKICPTIFGPYFWSVIHMTALSAPRDMSEDQAEKYVRFYNSLPDVLPCTVCGKHLRENLTLMPVDTKNLFRWSVELHNLVNSQLNKPEIPYDKALSYWSSRCARKTDQHRIGMFIAAVVIAFLVVIILSRIK